MIQYIAPDFDEPIDYLFDCLKYWTYSLPNHKDPFDRLIIATAISEQLTLVSIDRKLEHYKEYVNIIG